MSSNTAASIPMSNLNNRNSENVAIWSHISCSLLFSWLNEQNSQRKVYSKLDYDKNNFLFKLK